MKRVLLLVTLVVLTLGLVAGCVGVKTYKNVGEDIKIGVGQEFIIALGSNPSTGYSWEASYDETMLELVGGEPEYEADEVGDDVVGAGGVELFRFLALAAGETEITLVYAQHWEGGGVGETKVFTVVIE
ncbi:MAG: protease inhibitor I42 family protein [Chloroflexi bacterium]|nr:protease inhibitor I42 family protein [Chloroflexota bacterium]